MIYHFLSIGSKMADSVNIEFADDFEEPNRQPLPQDTEASQPQSVTPDPNVTPNTRPFSFTSKSKAKQKEIDEANRARTRERREQIAEQKRILRESQQDATAERRRQYKEQKAAAQESITRARSEAISSRVQSYGLASALGLPGYIGASIIDSSIIRPDEASKVDAQKQYLRDLDIFKRAQEADAIEEKRRREEQIRNTPVTATPVGPPPTTPPTNTIPPSIGPGSGGSGGSGGTGGAGGKPPGGGTPPPIQPTPPTPGGPNPILGLIGGPVGVAVIEAIQGAQKVNQAVDNISSQLNTTLSALASNNAPEALKGGAKTFQNTADPLGINIPLNVVVDGFTSLLDINSAILSTIKNSEAFAPQTLTADIEGQLLRLGKQIEVAQRLDGVTSQLVRVNTQFDLAWQELRASLLQDLLPFISANI